MENQRGFASDNCSGIHPKVMEAIAAANTGHVPSYGDDVYTASAVGKFREHFGPECDIYFVWGGTGANIVGLQAVTKPYNAIICPETAHINVHECGAPEKFTGCKLLTAPCDDGKLRPEQCFQFLEAVGNSQMVQPAAISISQPTELGTVYSVDEIRDLTAFAHDNDMALHVDGARLANAAVYLGIDFKEMTFDAGVDLLSFGGTKNGMMVGEAVVFADRSHADEMLYIRKQAMQLSSKMRFTSAQFEAILTDGLAFELAGHANKMAGLMAGLLAEVPGVSITRKVESNGVFAIIPPDCVEALQKQFQFYVVDSEKSEVRLMCSFDTTEEDIRGFAAAAGKFIEG